MVYCPRLSCTIVQTFSLFDLMKITLHPPKKAPPNHPITHECLLCKEGKEENLEEEDSDDLSNNKENSELEEDNNNDNKKEEEEEEDVESGDSGDTHTHSNNKGPEPTQTTLKTWKHAPQKKKGKLLYTCLHFNLAYHCLQERLHHLSLTRRLPSTLHSSPCLFLG